MRSRPRSPSCATEATEATEAEEITADSLLLTEEAARFALPGVHHYQVRGVRIEAPVGVDITLNGEIGALTPAEVCIAGKQIQVLLPAEAHQWLAGLAAVNASTSRQVVL